jgi:hypothetical protein
MSCMQAAEAKQQARRNRQLARQQRKKQAAGAAKDQIRKFSSSKRARSSSDAAEKHGDVKLPDAVLQIIVGCLAAFEPGGVRGPSMVARDLANAALVSATVMDQGSSAQLCCRQSWKQQQCSSVLLAVRLAICMLLSCKASAAASVRAPS